MKVKVQSLHFLDDERLVAIWRRSAFDAEYQDWFKYWLRRDRKSDLGQLEIRRDGGENNYYFWANWLETNRGLVPILDPDVFGPPLRWRVIGESGITEFERPEFSIPISFEWLQEKIAAIGVIEEGLFQAALRRAEELSERINKLLKRRDK